MSDETSQTPRPDLKNPLFLAVGVVVAVGVVTAVAADGTKTPSWALESNLVYRGEVGLAAIVILYVIVVLLWLAAHRLTFKSITAGPASTEIPQATQEMAASAQKVEGLGNKIDEIADRSGSELAYHDARLQRIEGSWVGRLLPAPPQRSDDGGLGADSASESS